MNQLLASSSNPERLSMTLQGLLLAFVPVTLGIFQLLDIPLTESDLMELIQAITAATSAILLVYGSVRKFVNAFLMK